jgi:UDP-glucose 4-epimerase
VSKLAGERYLYYFHVQHGLDVTCLRYANVYGERQNPHGEAGVVAIFLDRLLTHQVPTINGDGLQTRDYIHVSDVVRANLAALGRIGFGIFNVGTGLETSVVDLFAAIRKATDSEIEADHGPAKPGEQQRSSVDASRIRRELRLPEPLALAEGLQRTAAWFRASDAT